SGIAHELNNPLTAILGYAQIISGLEGVEQERAAATIEVEAHEAPSPLAVPSRVGEGAGRSASASEARLPRAVPPGARAAQPPRIAF
ncbi:MAG: hypothetical protein EXR64_03810, partial [Dehalococcoidia bacterium]|nr:hypothetical protein [Dehalococcoidia bacterium]